MYAILKTGGKQYRIEQGRFLDVERLSHQEGATFQLDGWILKDDGGLEDAKITLISLGEHKADKVLIFKKKRRTNYRRFKGHRQVLTRVRVEEIAS